MGEEDRSRHRHPDGREVGRDCWNEQCPSGTHHRPPLVYVQKLMVTIFDMILRGRDYFLHVCCSVSSTLRLAYSMIVRLHPRSLLFLSRLPESTAVTSGIILSSLLPVVLIASVRISHKVYRLHRPSGPGVSISLSYTRSLYGHTAGITALRVADGRCVSLGCDGQLWIWNLEDRSGHGISIGNSSDGSGELAVHARRGSIILNSPLVVFDERRVVASLRENVVIYQFDL